MGLLAQAPSLARVPEQGTFATSPAQSRTLSTALRFIPLGGA